MRNLLLTALAITTQVTAQPALKSVAKKHSEFETSKITPATPTGDWAQWVTSDDYPADALRNGSTGAVNFTLAIDEAGKAADCAVTESSGDQTLDDVTCALMMARARFTPAHDEKGHPVADTFHRKIRWQLPGTREIWTLDQIRFSKPKDANALASFANEHSMDAVVARLKMVGIAFERSTAELDTGSLPVSVIDQINGLPASEPFLIPQADRVTINVITARKSNQIDAPAARLLALPSPISAQVTLSYDVDSDGKPRNCLIKGELPAWMMPSGGLCKDVEQSVAIFSPDPKKQTRRVVINFQVSVTSIKP